MKPLTRDELLPFEDYEQVRDAFRRRIIELKQRRRIAVGDRLTLLFENRETIQFQVQEMIRAERIFDPIRVQHELDVYNPLLPAAGELSATLFIEITETDRIKQDLDSFQGIDRGDTVAIAVGPHRMFGQFEGGHSKEDKISAVHFVRFRLSKDFLDGLLEGGSAVSIIVSHPACHAQALVPEEMRLEWLADLGLQPVVK